MGRSPRIKINNCHYHVIARCNNEAFRFETSEDFEFYLDVLRFVRKKYSFKLYNYELMNSHVHLFLEPQEIELDKLMRLINWKYALDYNKRRKRKGHFWLERFKSIPVESDRYALALMRYMNRNPLRAGMVKAPGEWKWSAYRFYAFGESNDLLLPHPSYLALGDSPILRQNSYMSLVNMEFPGDEKRNPKFSDVKYIGSR